jgi:hypothetical protein
VVEKKKNTAQPIETNTTSHGRTVILSTQNIETNSTRSGRTIKPIDRLDL